MKKSWAMKWARDLETTSARQTTDVLNNGNGGFCCLGRLCVVAGLRGKRTAELNNALTYDGASQLIPESLRHVVGMRTTNGEYSMKDTLAKLNDAGASFPEIAKIIRKHWQSL